MKLPRLLKQFLAQCGVYTALCLGIEIVLRRAGWGYPYNYPVDAPSIFSDFRFFIAKYARFHSRQFFDVPSLPYPAPSLVVYKLFLPRAAIQHHHLALAAFLLFILAVSWVMLFMVYQALTHRGLSRRSAVVLLAVMYLTSFPFWFEFHQANIEVMVWIAVSLGMWAHWTNRSWTAALCFGAATALKLFPFLFLGLLLARRQYRQLALSIAAAGLITLASVWLVCPDVGYSWHATNATLARMRPEFMLSPVTSGFDHTLYALTKKCLPLHSSAAVNRLLAIYIAIAVLTGTLLYFLRIRKLPVLNQVLCLTVASVLLPPISFDYTLVHLYAPLVLLIFAVLARPHESTKPLVAVLGLLAFLLSAQSELIWHGVRFSGQVKAIALLALFALGLIYPFEIPPAADADQHKLTPAAV